MASSGQHKISPRKFSEKIALLNKKEAEGNAEFEEIIKEVQATRSVNSIKVIKKSGTRKKKQDELEEVFENLIKCVGQFEQELQDSHQSIDYDNIVDSSIGPCQNINPINGGECKRSASVEPSNHLVGCLDGTTSTNGLHRGTLIHTTANSTPLDRYGPQPVNYLAPGIPGNQSAHTNNDSGYEAAIGNNLGTSSKGVDIIAGGNQSMHFYEGATCQQAHIYQQPNQIRTRVTSIGSANYRNLCSNINNNNQMCGSRYQCQDGSCWVTCQQEIYLRPAYDKSAWQKSCSDSALHVPSQSALCRPVCSENPLAMELAAYNNNNNNNNNNSNNNNNDNNTMAIPIVDGSGRPINTLMEEEQRDNVGTVQPSTNTYMDSTITADYDETFKQSGSYLIDSTKSTLNLQPDASQPVAAEGQAQCFNLDNQVDRGLQAAEQQQQQQQQQQLYHQQANVINDVPGISICMIEDDGSTLAAQLKLEANQQTCSSRDSSLPDISNLQFNINEEIENQHRLQDGINESMEFHDFTQDPESTYSELPGEWFSTDPKVNDNNNISTSHHQQANNNISPSTCEVNDLPTNWHSISTNTNREALCEPKIDQQILSSSDCGLPTNLDYDCSQGHQFGNNIIRSHSHSSIDYYANKHKVNYVHHHHQNNNNNNNLFNQPLSSHNNSSNQQRCQQYGLSYQHPLNDQEATKQKNLVKEISESKACGISRVHNF